jgi:Rrf2 family nitric oxide-sensitive transcriptional repressor
MKLLASTDFALRVLMLLSRQPAESHMNVEALSRELGGLSRNHLHKIVQDLTALGITRTVRGAGGGVMLAIAPDQVPLGRLVRQLETDQALVECFRLEGCTCTLVPECRLRSLLRDAQNSFYASLDRHTLADCLPTMPCGAYREGKSTTLEHP